LFSSDGLLAQPHPVNGEIDLDDMDFDDGMGLFRSELLVSCLPQLISIVQLTKFHCLFARIGRVFP
jgi:hypothetical protein